MKKTINFCAYVDVIFGIAQQNNKDVGVGADMFLTNLTVANEDYKGAAGRRALDYKALSAVWYAMSAQEQSAARRAYKEQVERHYNKLDELSQEERHAEMVQLLTEEG